MLEIVLLLVLAIGAGAFVLAVSREKEQVDRLTGSSQHLPQLLVFDFPTENIDAAAQAAAIEAVRREWRGIVEVQRVRVFDQLEYTAQFGIYTVPSTILLDSHGRVAFINESDTSAETLSAQLATLAPPPAGVIRTPARAQAGAHKGKFDLYETREELPCQS